METGRDEYITFLLKALAGGRGRAFPNCSWLEQEALVRHVWAEVILDVSHTPAGQLVLGQVKAKAAQLENCGLGFRSLQEAQYMLWWSVSSRLRRLLINSVQRRRQRKGSPVSAVCPWRETQTDLGCSWPSQPCLYDPKRASTASRSLRDEIQTWPVGSEDVFQARCVLARVGKRDAKCQSLTWTGRKGSSSAPFHLENSRQTIFSISLRGQRMKSISCVQPITSCSSRQAKQCWGRMSTNFTKALDPSSTTYPSHWLVSWSMQLHNIFLQEFYGTLERVAGIANTSQDVFFVIVGHHWHHFSNFEKCRLLLL